MTGLIMYIRHFGTKLTVAAAALAMLAALPGSASPNMPAAPTAAPPTAFGLFLDPHIEPTLHITLPQPGRQF